MIEKERHALIIHGLNNDPQAMTPLAKLLGGMGIDSTLAQLTGHFESEARAQAFGTVTAELWLSDAANAYRQAVERHPGKEIILAGNSLGALLGLRLSQTSRVRFEKMILFAPAIHLRPWSYFPRLLGTLNIRLPSGMPKAIRANSGTPISAYEALFQLVRRFEPDFVHPPALVVMDPRDELVSYAKVRAWTQRNPANRLLTIKSPARFKHLLTDQTFVGEANWRLIGNAIKELIEPQAIRANV